MEFTIPVENCRGCTKFLILKLRSVWLMCLRGHMRTLQHYFLGDLKKKIIYYIVLALMLFVIFY
jgi:hypothetical protein